MQSEEEDETSDDCTITEGEEYTVKSRDVNVSNEKPNSSAMDASTSGIKSAVKLEKNPKVILFR